MLGQQAAQWPALPASQLEECSSSRALPLLLDLRTMSEHCSSLGHTLRFPVAGPGEWYKAPWIPLSHSPSSGGVFFVAEKVEQSQGEEAEAVGGASGHGCCLCQSGCCQQGDSPFQFLHSSLNFIFF